MADLWFYADPHFGHDAIRTYCERPFKSTKEMDEELLYRYNAMVKQGDDVIFLGDFAFRNHNKYLAQLPGNKTFVFGNHDKMAEATLRNFSRVVGSRRCPGIIEMSVGLYAVTGSHFPMASWNASHYGSMHVHGHCHGRMPEPEDMLRCDIGVDVWGFAPVNFELIRRKLTARIPAWKTRQARMEELYSSGLRDNGLIINRHAAEEVIAEALADPEYGKRLATDYHLRYKDAQYKKELKDLLYDSRRSKPEPEPES